VNSNFIRQTTSDFDRTFSAVSGTFPLYRMDPWVGLPPHSHKFFIPMRPSSLASACIHPIMAACGFFSILAFPLLRNFFLAARFSTPCSVPFFFFTSYMRLKSFSGCQILPKGSVHIWHPSLLSALLRYISFFNRWASLTSLRLVAQRLPFCPLLPFEHRMSRIFVLYISLFNFLQSRVGPPIESIFTSPSYPPPFFGPDQRL